MDAAPRLIEQVKQVHAKSPNLLPEIEAGRFDRGCRTATARDRPELEQHRNAAIRLLLDLEDAHEAGNLPSVILDPAAGSAISPHRSERRILKSESSSTS